MRTIFLAAFCGLFCMHLYSQPQLYNYDENLDVKRSFSFQKDTQSKTIMRTSNSTNNGDWNHNFSIPGIIGYIYATATDGINLYVGGNFRMAGSTIANSIVKWDGKKWTSLGEGSENGVGGDIPSVEAVAVVDGKVYIGGQFQYAGSKRVNGVACWDGSKWNQLGNDSINGVKRFIYLENDTLITGGFVYSLFAHNNKIYIGGDFDMAGEIHSKGIAAWNPETETWDQLEGGLSGTYPGESAIVYDFAGKDNKIYAGGKFSFAGGSEAKNIAVWDSTGWTAIGNANGYVFDLEFDSAGNLYATGYFSPNEEDGSSGLGRWDGNEWISIPGPKGINSYVRKVKAYKNGFFAAGNFENDTLIPPVGLAYWDGLQWKLIRGLGQAHNEFLPESISEIELISDRLFVTGGFTKSGKTYAVNVAEWDIRESSWRLLDDESGNQGIHDGWIYTMAEKGDTIYVGGSFSVAGGVYTRNIAQWSGDKWQSVGQNYENGIRGSVNCILRDNNMVYVGGYFGSAGSTAAFHVAKWDGTKWSSVGIGVGGVPGAFVNALAKIGNYLYVGGYFSVVGDEENYDLPANSIARFDLLTNRWETLGRGIEYVYGLPGRVNVLTAHENKLYVGGDFHSADDRNFDNFAVLVDNKWDGIDGYKEVGIDGRISAIKVINGEIYIAGQFNPEPGGETYGILKWEGKKWIPVGDLLTIEGEDVFVSDIEPYGDGFIAGGHFSAGSNDVSNIGYFDGQLWHGIGGGIWPGVGEVQIAGDRLFLAGPQELFADGFPGASLAVYNFSYPTKIEDLPAKTDNPVLMNYPNPFQSKTTIWYKVQVPGHVRLSLFDARGREINTLFNGYRNNGTYSFEITKGELLQGIYICRMIQGNHQVTNRMVVLE